MARIKTKIAVVSSIGILLIVGTATVTFKEIQKYTMDNSWRTREVELKKLNTVSAQVRILPSKYIPYGGWTVQHGKIMGVADEPIAIVKAAYNFKGLQDRIVPASLIPEGSYDFIASLPSGNFEALQAEIKRKFGLVAKVEMIETNVLLMTVKNLNAPGLRPSRKQGGSFSIAPQGGITGVDMQISDLTDFTELYLETPVIDKTGLRGNYDYDLQWDEEWDGRKPVTGPFKQALLQRLGLELVPTNMPVKMLVVEKVK